MRYSAEQKEETRKKIQAAASRSFRQNGYAGIGIDGLAKEAGVTSGAFYKHFPSKKAAFESAVVSGMEEIHQAIRAFRDDYGNDWWKSFAEFYMTEKRTCAAAESCGFQSLTPEIVHSDIELKQKYDDLLLQLALSANGNPDTEISSDIWIKLALLLGGLTLARAVESPELSEKIGNAVKSSSIFEKE